LILNFGMVTSSTRTATSTSVSNFNDARSSERPLKRARFAEDLDDVDVPTKSPKRSSHDQHHAPARNGSTDTTSIPSTTNTPTSIKRSTRPNSSTLPIHRPHPLGLKPSGNALFNPLRALSTRRGGLGTLFLLPDELVLELLSPSYLPAHTLFTLQACSRALFAFSRHQALWKAHCVLRGNGVLERWDGDWRRTYFATWFASEGVVRRWYEDAGDDKMEEELVMPVDGIRVPDLCSDVLYQPHLCAAPLDHYFMSTSTPGNRALENLLRMEASDMDANTFAERFGRTSIPVVLTGLMDSWVGFQLDSESSRDRTSGDSVGSPEEAEKQVKVDAPAPAPRWSLPSLVHRYADVPFRAEAVLAPLSIYARYCQSVERALTGVGISSQVDESPLYLFDSEFVRRTGGGMGGDFEVPSLFGEDLFRVMGTERPDHRWLVRERSSVRWEPY
jgi:hypothetical protein